MTEEEKRDMSGLVERCSKGDHEARETLYSRFYKTIYCFIYRIIKSEYDAEDLAQETFIRLYRRDFSEKVWTSGHTYIFQIAKNLCLDLFRRQKRRDNLFNSIKEKGGAEACGEEARDFGFISKALNEDEERLVFLRYGSGYSVKEISSQTGIPMRTLERQLNVIREKVRKAAEDIDYDEE